jgi:hypothetical protein
MPAFGILMLVAQLACAIHAGRTGRPFFWIYIVLFVPGAGMAAYFLVEILPELLGGRTARRAAAGVVKMLDPEKAYRAAQREVEISATTQTRANLADQCVATGRFDEGVALYRELLVGMHATDPDLMMRLARAEFTRGDFAAAQHELEALRSANPDYRSPDGHLLYARSLENQGLDEAALYEYEALAEYYPGQEAKCRLAALLQRTGRTERAMHLFAEVCRGIELMPRHARRVQREWYEFARRSLREARVEAPR